MKFDTINGMGFKGLNSDIAPWELEKEFITFGTNFRSSANRIISAGADEDLSTPPNALSAGHIVPVMTNNGNFWISLGRDAGTFKAQVYDGSTWSDITSAAGYASIGANGQLNWTSCMLGYIPIVNNPQHVPEYWKPQQASQILQPLQFDPINTWSAKSYTFKVIRSHRNFLFALNLVQGITELPNSYRWSNPADSNNLPFTWDETDTSAIAGIDQIGGDGGQILDGATLRDSFCIYSERSINILDPSNDEFVWRERELSNIFGIIATNCVAQLKGYHLALGDGDIVFNDGNTIHSAIHNRIRGRLTSQMSADFYDRSFAVRNNALKEVWFCVPEDNAQYPNTAYVYNWRDDAWSVHALPYAESAGIPTEGIAHAAYGPQPDPNTTYDTVSDTYDTTTLIYGSQQNTPLNNTIVGVDAVDDGLRILDPSNPITVADTNFFVERTDIALEGQDNITTITRVYPYMDSLDEIDIQIGSQQFANGPITWSNPIRFDPSQDRKIDVRSTGRLHCWRMYSVGTGKVSTTGIGVEYELAGKR